MDSLVQQLDHLRLTTENKSAEDPSVKELVETYAKAVCDCTFYHENFLTEKDFKEEGAEKDVRHIISLFDAIAALCASVDKSPPNESIKRKMQSDNVSDDLLSVINVLGIDFAECIPWRQGSILYAFCNCKTTSDPAWMNANQVTFLNYLHEGINYLQTMLSIRRPDRSHNKSTKTSGDSLVQTFKVPLDDLEVEEVRKTLLRQEQMLGEKGQELEQLEEILEHQQEINHEALLDIQQQLNQQPHLEDVLQEVQMEVQAQQQEVLDQQEDQAEQKKQLQEKFLQLQLQQNHLQAMMREIGARMAASAAQLGQEESGSGDPNTLKLVKLGIFSDPHLLAAMYSGEMAYWYCSYSDGWDVFEPGDKNATDTIDQLVSLGKSMMLLYRKAVNKCGLADVGWSCERAQELLAYFRKFEKKRKG